MYTDAGTFCSMINANLERYLRSLDMKVENCFTTHAQKKNGSPPSDYFFASHIRRLAGPASRINRPRASVGATSAPWPADSLPPRISHFPPSAGEITFALLGDART